MLKQNSIDLHNMLLSLSDAVDLADPKLASHQLRTAYIAWKLAKSAKLGKSEKERVYMASLLHDIGAISVEHKMKLLGLSVENSNTHALIGGAILDSCSVLSTCSGVVRNHHKEWAEWDDTIDSPDVFHSQIVFLADTVERMIDRDHYILHQHDEITGRIQKLAGTQIHPDVIDLFMNVSTGEDFWLDLTSPRLYSLLLHQGPLQRANISLEDVFSIAEVIRSIIDFKSPFTATHSTGVAECSARIAQAFGFTKKETELIALAGSLHDLGKLVVPNSILEKPGKLTKDEFSVVKQHPYFTYVILSTIGGLNEIAEWASFHHEVLTGTGYPFHVPEDRICTESRILAVADIFTALAEGRPYRKNFTKDQIQKILLEKAEIGHIDKKILQLSIDNFDPILESVQEKQATIQEYFENQINNVILSAGGQL